ncbi:MAG: LytTR family transcriptional regulator [Clostridiaceae bacterium]|nr:LytTR family transcriptional regulator [Clostridiaceae bacterium]
MRTIVCDVWQTHFKQMESNSKTGRNDGRNQLENKYDRDMRLFLKSFKKEPFHIAFWAYGVYETLYRKYVVASNQRLTLYRFDDIIYMESSLHSVTIHTINGVETIQSKLDEEEKKIPGWKFIRIHQSYIVNLIHVKSLTSTEVILYNGHKLKISASRRRQVLRSVEEFAGWAENG